MPTERTGTITATNGSRYLVGVDTKWRARHVQTGAKLMFTTNDLPQLPMYEVEEVVDDTHITLRQTYQGATGSGKAYEILDVAYDKSSAEVYDVLTNHLNEIAQILDKADGAAASGKFVTLDASGKITVGLLPTNGANGLLKLDAAAKAPADNLPDLVKNSNPNLLHNWDFCNPVNQRGAATYLDTAKQISTIDRWKASLNMRVEVTSGGVRLTGLTQAYRRFTQQFEHPNARLAGKRVTVSLNVAECTGKFSIYFLYGASLASTSGGFILEAGAAGIQSGSITLPDAAAMADSLALCIATSSDTDVSLTLKAVKMEIGAVSTLKETDAACYAEQLAICQRFLLPLSKDCRYRLVGYPSATVLQFLIPLPVCPRILPSIENKENIVLKSNTLANISDVAITAIEGLRMYTGYLLRVTTTNAHNMTDGLLYVNEATFLNAEL